MQTSYRPNQNPRVIIIQKLYGKFFNKSDNLTFSKHRFKKFIKDVVNGTIERDEIITEELKKDSSMIDFLQTHNMIPGSKVSIADAGEFSITITTDNNNYFGIDKFIAKRVFVVWLTS